MSLACIFKNTVLWRILTYLKSYPRILDFRHRYIVSLVSCCILNVSDTQDGIRQDTLRIHVSALSHMDQHGRMWDTLGYTEIHQDTSARVYPHKLRTIHQDTAGIRTKARIHGVFSSLLSLYLPCCPRASRRSCSSSLESGSATRARCRAGAGCNCLPAFAAAFFDAPVYAPRTTAP